MTDLYRFYDIDNQLLYIGISLHAAQRASQHRGDKSWWPDVDRMVVDHLNVEREEAHKIERDAIRDEKPIHNVTHNTLLVLQAEVTSTGAPVEFDASFVVGWDLEGRERHRILAEAMNAVATRLDQLEDSGEEAAGRTDFLDSINGMAKSLIYGDMCHDCYEVRYPLILKYQEPGWVRCGYICDACSTQWSSGWTADLAALARCR